MVMQADVYEVRLAPASNSGYVDTWTVPSKYAYAVVQAQIGEYVADQYSADNGNIGGTVNFIRKGGSVIRQSEFKTFNNGGVLLTVIGYLPN